MRKTIPFSVEGELPPKKRGEKSMWGNSTEAPRLMALREAAKQEMRNRGYKEPLEGNLRLTLTVYVGAQKERKSGRTGPGDLDNFITGVCDGLMAAHPNIRRRQDYWAEEFRTCEDESLLPSEPIAFEDDRYVTEICAKKVVDPALGNGCRYEVKLEELTS